VDPKVARKVKPAEDDDEERMRKLVLFESLFYKIDNDGNGAISMEEADRLLSFCAMGLDPLERKSAFAKYDLVADGELNRLEFCRMCSDYLWSTPSHLLEKMVDNLHKAQGARKACNSSYWTEVGAEIEKKARIVVPLVYAFVMLLLFNLDMRDPYNTDASASMFAGMTKMTSVSPLGVGILTTYVASIVVGVVSTHLINRSIARSEEAQAQLQKEASRQVAHDVAEETKRGKLTRQLTRQSTRTLLRQMSQRITFSIPSQEPRDAPLQNELAAANLPPDAAASTITIDTIAPVDAWPGCQLPPTPMRPSKQPGQRADADVVLASEPEKRESFQNSERNSSPTGPGRRRVRRSSRNSSPTEHKSERIMDAVNERFSQLTDKINELANHMPSTPTTTDTMAGEDARVGERPGPSDDAVTVIAFSAPEFPDSVARVQREYVQREEDRIHEEGSASV